MLLVSANRERAPYPVFPIGLAYVAAALERAGHILDTVDLCFEEDAPAALAAKVAAFSPDVVVVSIRNIDNVTFPGYRSYLAGVQEVVDAFRGSVSVIVGGSGFSLMPVVLMERLGADYGIVGEGEEILPLLLARIETGASVEGLPGVLVKGSATFLPPIAISAIGAPSRTLFPLARYHREGGMANLQTKRGCPFSCVYCTYPLLEGRQMRLRAIPEVIAEITELVASGIRYLYFVDDIFNYPVDYAEKLCRAIAAENLSVKWTAFVNPGFFPSSLLDAMLAAGCDGIEFGTEAGCDTMLRNLGKSFSTDDIREASQLCTKRGVDFAHYILFGGPGETEETIAETFRLMDEVAPTAVIGMIGIRVFPGTPLYQIALREGLCGAPETMLEPVFYLPRGIKESICDIVTGLALERKNWVVPGLEINISDAMLQALRMMPVQGPLWKLMKRLGRNRVRPLQENSPL